MDRESRMDGETEKYPVCPERNTAAAFRWFYQPLSARAYLKGQGTPRRAAADLLPAPRAPEHRPDRR
jgi:hypothetical protein